MQIRTVAVLLVSFVTAFCQKAAVADERVVTAGDTTAQQFVETADDLVQLLDSALRLNKISLPDGFNYETLKSRIATAKVSSAEKTTRLDIETDALNYPEENKIVVNRNRLSRLVYNYRGIRILVLHEYLGLAGIDDGTYSHSLSLTRKLLADIDDGSLWLLKDLAWPGFQNPFRTPALEVSAALFASSGEARSRFFQSGKEVAAQAALNPSLPFCVLSTTGTLPTPGRNLRVLVTGTEKSDSAQLGTEAVLRVDQTSLVTLLRCASQSASRRATLSDLISSFGSHVKFTHEGSAPLANAACPASPSAP